MKKREYTDIPKCHCTLEFSNLVHAREHRQINRVMIELGCFWYDQVPQVGYPCCYHRPKIIDIKKKLHFFFYVTFSSPTEHRTFQNFNHAKNTVRKSHLLYNYDA